LILAILRAPDSFFGEAAPALCGVSLALFY
jgi:hypothetical protein